VESGLPLAGVTVAARRGGAVFSSAVADPLGDFALDWLAPWETHELVVADHAVVAAPGGVATFTLVPGEDRHQFDIAAEPSPNGLVPGNAGRDESGLPAAPLFPPGSLFDLVTERPLRVVNSWDPNDKNGNDDLGDPVPPDEELEYTVYFENEAGKASGPAQEIVITDQLDPAKFDLTTFEVRDVRLGNLPYQFAPLSHQGFEQASGYTTSPSSRRSFGTDTFPVRTVVEDQGEVFEFDQEIAVSWELEGTGRAVWRLETDSTEALVGVLPVNDAEKGGEGHVSFAVKPLPGLAAGSELENQAQIRFDDNPLITTRTWVNVIALPQPPAAPAYPRPADGAGGVEASVVLQWQSSGDSFDVFLWREGQTKPAVPEAVAAPHFKPAALAPGTSYLWQVTARNGQGSAAGPTWRFSAHQDPPFVRGDANADGAPNIADASHLLDHLFAGGAAPSCRASADANADGVVDVSDAIRLLLALFVTGAPLPPPYPACGVPAGPEAGVLSCRSFPGCP
jgi:hypothetical protein